MSRNLLVKDRIQVEQLRASPSAVVRVLIPVAQPEEHCINPVATKRMPRLDEPLSPVPAGGAQSADAANGRSKHRQQTDGGGHDAARKRW